MSPLLAPLLVFTTLTLVASSSVSATLQNHLVSELERRTVTGEKASMAQELTVELQKEGWVYLRVVPVGAGQDGLFSVAIDGQKPVELSGADTIFPHEGMHFLSAGKHRLVVSAAENAKVEEVIVRSIPEIFYFSADYHSKPIAKLPHAKIRSYHELKKRGIIQNYNVISSEAFAQLADYLPELEKWRASGRKWMTLSKVPRKDNSAEEVELLWATPMSHPKLDGVIIDEFGPGERNQTQFPFWGKALRELATRPHLKGKQFYAFTGFSRPSLYAPLANALVDMNYRIAPELYFRSMALLESAPERMMEWKKEFPGIEEKMVIFLGPDNIAPTMTFHLLPEMNYKVFLEEQFRVLATNEAFSGIAGIGIWTARYMDDDILNWYTCLLRHYLIEGQTKRLGNDPLFMNHLTNPSFEERESGWVLEPASEGGISFRQAATLPYKKSPYSAIPSGKVLLQTKRHGEKANRIKQTVQNLTPGRVYHLNVYALDPKDRNRKELIPLGVEIKGVELLKADNRVLPSQASPNLASTAVSDEFDFQVNAGKITVHTHQYHRLFRALGETAELILSDWGEDESAHLTAPSEVLWDFIELAPDFSLEQIK